jgi:hypothetical protein
MCEVSGEQLTRDCEGIAGIRLKRPSSRRDQIFRESDRDCVSTSICSVRVLVEFLMISGSQFTPLVITRLVILLSLLGTLVSVLFNGFTNPIVSLFFFAFVFVAGVAEFLPLTAEKWVFHTFPVFRTHRPVTLAVAAAPLLWSPPRTAGYLMLIAATATYAKVKSEISSSKLVEEPLEERIYQVL